METLLGRLGLHRIAWGLVAGGALAIFINRQGGMQELAGVGSASAERTPGADGEDANHPTEIPARSWWDILKRAFAEISADRVLAVAAGVAFYALLATVPAITAFVSLYGLVADRSTIIEHLAMLDALLPASAVDMLREQAARIVGAGEAKLSLALAFSLALSLWSANAGMKAMFDSLNVAYDEDETRGFFRLNATSLLFTLGALVFAMLAIAAIAVAPAILSFFYLGPWASWIIWLGRWPLIFLALMLGLALLYRFGPSRKKAKWRWVSPGAIAASLAFVAFSVLFSWYAANFGNYDKTYGSLGAVVALLIWMWLSAAIILAGAELNAEAEQQTHRDTTSGPPKPIGARGAYVADVKEV